MVLYAPDLDSTEVVFSIEERIFELERDEDAMLERLKNTNLRAQGVDTYLYSRQGPMADLQAGKEMSLGSIIEKKKTFVKARTIKGNPFIL